MTFWKAEGLGRSGVDDRLTGDIVRGVKGVDY